MMEKRDKMDAADIERFFRTGGRAAGKTVRDDRNCLSVLQVLQKRYFLTPYSL